MSKNSLLLAAALVGGLCGCSTTPPDRSREISVVDDYQKWERMPVAYWVQIAKSGSRWDIVKIDTSYISTNNDGTEVLGFTRNLKMVTPMFRQVGKLSNDNKKVEVQNFSSYGQTGPLHFRCSSDLVFKEYNPCNSELTTRSPLTTALITIGTSGLSSTLPGHSRWVDTSVIYNIVNSPEFQEKLKSSPSFQLAEQKLKDKDKAAVTAAAADRQREIEAREARNRAIEADEARKIRMARLDAAVRVNARELIPVDNNSEYELFVADNITRNGRTAEAFLFYNMKSSKRIAWSSKQTVITRNTYGQDTVGTQHVTESELYRSVGSQAKIDCETGRMANTIERYHYDVFASDFVVKTEKSDQLRWWPAPAALLRLSCSR